MVPANSHRISRVPRYSGYHSHYTQPLYGTITRYGRTFQTSSRFVYNAKCGPITPTMPKHHWFGLFPFRSPLLRESLLFSFPPGTKMFQFSGFFIHGIYPLGNFGFIIPPPNFSWFFTSLFYYTSSHPSNTYIYFSLLSCARGESNPCPDLGRI